MVSCCPQDSGHVFCLVHKSLQPWQLQLGPQWPSHGQESVQIEHQHRPRFFSAAVSLYWHVSAGQLHSAVHRFLATEQLQDLVPHVPLEH